MKNPLILILLIFIYAAGTNAQPNYNTVGDAQVSSCQCYTLTRNMTYETGAIWEDSLYNLNVDQEWKYMIYLGTNSNGAEGIAFVLQPNNPSTIGLSQSQLGAGSISNTVIVEIDTYDNDGTDTFDLSVDHISIEIDGDLPDASINLPPNQLPLFGPTPAHPTGNTLCDGQLHLFRVTWEASTQTISVFVDDSLRLSGSHDFINNALGGNTAVYSGFTGTTNSVFNEQKVCYPFAANFTNSNPKPSYCIGDTFSLSNTSFSDYGINSFEWFKNQLSLGTSPFQHFIVSETGNQHIELVVTDSLGCSDSLTLLFQVSAPEINLSSDSLAFCPGNSSPVSLSYTAVFPTPPCTYTFLLEDDYGDGWNGGYLTVTTGTSTSIIKAINHGFSGTPTLDSVFVQVNSGDLISLSYSTGSYGSEVSFSLLDADGNLLYTQNNPFAGFHYSTTASCPPDTSNFLFTSWYVDGTVYHTTDLNTTVTTATPIVLSVTDTLRTFCTLSDTINIYFDKLLVDAGPDLEIMEGDSTLLTPNFNQNSASGFYWSYASPDLSLSNIYDYNPTASPVRSNTYMIHVTSLNGCIYQDSVTVLVVPLFPPVVKNCSLSVPTLFTPNQDGVNDTWHIACFDQLEQGVLKVFNRLGKEVFRTISEDYTPWDGQFEGSNVPQGSYFFVIQSPSIQTHGTITILRD